VPDCCKGEDAYGPNVAFRVAAARKLLNFKRRDLARLITSVSGPHTPSWVTLGSLGASPQRGEI
jgi:hypothetical protein